MRLIDADEFIHYLGLDCEKSREDNIGEIVTLEDFDRQPTAYDVDKVVENIRNSPTDEDGIICYVDGKPVIKKEYAINFVKLGDVDNGTD